MLARELPADVDWIHTHYLHTPASVARYAAMIRGLGWSFSAHAKDIWTTPKWELKAKLADAAWGVTCTRANLDYLRSLRRLAAQDRPRLSRARLLALSRRRRSARRSTAGPFTIVSVGRAVEKKGYSDLLAALAALRDEALALRACRRRAAREAAEGAGGAAQARRPHRLARRAGPRLHLRDADARRPFRAPLAARRAPATATGCRTC